MKKSLIYLSFFVLLGCQAGPYPVSSPYYTIPAGSKLTLRQTLVIQPNTARVYLQYGEVMTGKHVDQYYAHCWFLSWKVLETKQIIKPDTFLILGTKKTEVYVKSTTPFQLASSSSGINGGGLSAIEYTTTLTIASETQPDIRQFVCNHWEDPHDAQHLTVAEIRQAMGEIVTLKLHDPVATK